MMKLVVNTFLTALLLSLVGCVGLNETSKYQFIDGVYKAKIPGRPNSRVYILVSEDSIRAIPITRGHKQLTIDTFSSFTLPFPPTKPSGSVTTDVDFVQKTLDLDVLTILFKVRPGTTSIPTQLNTNFNGAFYLGFRSDKYSLSYNRSMLNSYKKTITHYGYSFGFFSGLGATTMNPYVTNSQVSQEYDGLILPNGLAAIVGINNLSVGFALGTDFLLDRHRSYWIYQGKPWLGLSVGLNIN
jgi:hypothetical protein